MIGHVLVTGGAGYLGSVLVPKLLREGHSVVVIDNFMYGQRSLLDCAACDRLKIVRGDARNEKLLKEYLPTADWILPLACLTGAPACDNDPVGARSLIVDGLESLYRLGNSRNKFIYPTTNSGYGIGQDGIYCDENTPLNPVSLYGRLKAEAEAIVLSRENGIALRLATVFGVSPRMRLDLLVNDFVFRAMRDRTLTLFEADFKRNYVHIWDVARCFTHCIRSFEKMQGQTYNLGLSDANLSKRELAEKIKEQIPNLYIHEAPIGKDPDQRNYIVSNAKLEATGFRAYSPVEQGISDIIRSYPAISHNPLSNA